MSRRKRINRGGVPFSSSCALYFSISPSFFTPAECYLCVFHAKKQQQTNPHGEEKKRKGKSKIKLKIIYFVSDVSV